MKCRKMWRPKATFRRARVTPVPAQMVCAQAGEIPETASCVSGGEYEGSVGAVDGVGDIGYLIGGEEA